MGAYSEDVLNRLRWLNDVMAPVLDAAIRLSGGMDMRALLAQSLHMGDDGHNRMQAGSLLFLKSLAPFIPQAAPSADIASGDPAPDRR